MTKLCLALIVAFIGSASMLGEIAWIRQLDRILGATSLSLMTVIGAYLCGMGLGSGLGAWLTRLSDVAGFGSEGRSMRSARDPGKLTGLLLGFQLIAAVWAFLSPLIGEGIGAVGDMVAFDARRSSLLFVNSGLSFSVLLVPGIVGGVCLPLMVQLAAGHGDANERGREVSFLWAWDAAGAAVTALLTGTLLIRIIGVTGVFRAEAALHLGLAVLLAFLQRNSGRDLDESFTEPSEAEFLEEDVQLSSRIASSHLAILTVVVAGVATVAWQALWSRTLVLSLSGSIAWPSIVIAFWIGGSAIGAAFYWKSDRLSSAPEKILAIGPVAGAGAGLAAVALGSKTEVIISTLNAIPWISGSFLLEILIGFLFFLPAAFMGMVLPAAVTVLLRKRSPRGRSSGEATGLVLVADVTGTVVATFLVSLVWIPYLGLDGAIWLTAALQALSGLLFMCFPLNDIRTRLASRQVGYGVLLLGIGALALSASDLKPWVAAEATRDLHNSLYERDEKPIREIWGPAAAAAVLKGQDGNLRLVVDRHHGMGGQRGVFIERRQGHIPMLLHGNAQDVLVIGIGTGNTLGAVARHAAVRIDAVESLESVLGMMDLFGDTNHRVWLDRRVRVHHLDGHTFLRRTTKRYDVIVTDLVHPWRSGASGLYNLDHLSRVKKKLAKGGVFCFWLPLHELDREDLAVVAATFLGAFQDGQAILGHLGWRQPILALLAGNVGDLFSRERLQPILNRFSVSDAKHVDLDTPEDLQSLFVGDADWLRQIADGAPVTTWDRPELAYRSARTWWKAGTMLGLSSLANVLATRRSVQTVAPNDDRAVKRHRAVGMLLRAEIAETRGLKEKAIRGYIEAARADETFQLPRILLKTYAKNAHQIKAYSGGE